MEIGKGGQLNLRIQPARRPQGKKSPKRLDVSEMNRQYETSLLNEHDLQPTGCNQSQFREPRRKLDTFYKTVHSSAATTLGHPSRKHQDWFDENDDEIHGLFEENHRLLKAQQDDTS